MYPSWSGSAKAKARVEKVRRKVVKRVEMYIFGDGRSTRLKKKG